jgi:hypothetical protein
MFHSMFLVAECTGIFEAQENSEEETRAEGEGRDRRLGWPFRRRSTVQRLPIYAG